MERFIITILYNNPRPVPVAGKRIRERLPKGMKAVPE